MLNRRERFWISILAFALWVSPAWAQQNDPRVNPPIAPVAPLSSGESSSKPPANSSGNTADGPQTLIPDTRPLSGAEMLTLGSVGRARSYFLPSFQFTQVGDTNARSTADGSKIDAASIVSGRIALQRVWRRYQLTADYTGGRSLYNNNSTLNASFHQFGVTQAIAGRRWSLQLSDHFSYLPESSSATAGFGTPSSLFPGLGARLDLSLPNLNPTLTPNQSILTGRAARISNAFVGELLYRSNSRSSYTLTGSYGILHYLDSGFINSSNAIVQVGYNRALTAQDTIAFTYGVSFFWFQGTDAAIDNHVFQIAYGRRVTGRLAFELSGGPQINRRFLNPGAKSDTQANWSLSSSLRYRYPRTELAVNYTRYVTGGAGVLLGAETDEIRMTVARQLSRMWSGSMNAGYAHNAPLRLVTGGPSASAFNYIHAGFSLDRPLGRYTGIFVHYDLQRQDSATAFCFGGTCGRALLRHYFGVGFNWHFRPVEID